MEFSFIPISQIDVNPHNPRGIEIARQDKKLPLLKDSIKNFGILVPLVVVKRDSRYLLVDGERRYVAAKALGLQEVPAYINEQGLSDDDLLYQMFHIHHNREQWGPIQQCNALEKSYTRIKNEKEISSIESEEAKIKAIAEGLANETGIEPRTALSRIYFLRWPQHIKKKLYEYPSDDYWYICEIEEKIIIPSLRNYPEYFEKVPVDEVREDLFKKLEEHSVKRATEVREIVRFTRTNMTKASDRKKVLKIFKQLHKNKDMTYSEAKEEFLKEFPDLQETPLTPRKLANEVERLVYNLQSFDTDKINEYKGRSKISIRDFKKIIQDALELLKDLIDRLSGAE